MIGLKPGTENHFICPACSVPYPTIQNILVRSIHVLADCICTSCNLSFYQAFPVGHAVNDQLSVSKSNGAFYKSDRTESWLFDSFVTAYEPLQKKDVKISRIVYEQHEHVLILNALDYLYGHVLLKLYNALFHLNNKNDLGLIIIIPRMFEWMIPPGCAEVWVVDLKLAELAYGYESIQKFVSEQFGRFKQIYLSRAFSHPDFTKIDIAQLTRVKPFDLEKYYDQKPTITFVLREDRWWLPSVVDYWFYRLCRKLKVLTWGSKVLSRRQNRLVKRTMRHIRKELPDAEICIVGLGATGNFGGDVKDERYEYIDPSIEFAWCDIYSRSHVVVGVHGSNMLLPTALAAGCVEILPTERYGNMVQDISVRYSDRRQLFFYRFADQYSAPRSVSEKVVAMIRHYDKYHKNMCRDLYS